MKKENQYNIHRYYEIEIPDELSKAVKTGLEQGGEVCRKRNRKKNIIKWGSMAAVAAIVCSIVISNPVLAAKVPIIGHVFEMLQGSYSFKGDYSRLATPLQEENIDTNKEDSVYTKESGGVKVSFSEIYCNNQAIYLALSMESKEGFPDTFHDMDGNQVMTIQIETSEKYSFNPSKVKAVRYLEGRMVDENTYAGILRISLDDINKDSTEFDKYVAEMGGADAYKGLPLEEVQEAEDFIKELDIPESFTMNLSITQIVGEFDGNWDYEIPIRIDNSKTQVLEINETNENGIGIASVEKTPFEIKVNEKYPEFKNGDASIISVALDANGEPLPKGGAVSDTNVYAIQDSDVSRVYLFICDWDEYMDIKGYYFSDDYEVKKKEKTFQQLLEEKALYYTEVQFTQ